jgi:hypothetical protein
VSRFHTVKVHTNDDKIQGLRTASSAQTFSQKELKAAFDDILRDDHFFIDKHFPTNEKSVMGNVKIPALPQKLEILNEKCQSMKWIRATEIDKDIEVIVDGIDPTDVIQGQLNNSYFLCAVSAVSEYQNRI